MSGDVQAKNERLSRGVQQREKPFPFGLAFYLPPLPVSRFTLLYLFTPLPPVPTPPCFFDVFRFPLRVFDGYFRHGSVRGKHKDNNKSKDSKKFSRLVSFLCFFYFQPKLKRHPGHCCDLLLSESNVSDLHSGGAKVELIGANKGQPCCKTSTFVVLKK